VKLPPIIPTAKVVGVLVEYECMFCKGRGNFDVEVDGEVLKCPGGPCANCKGSGRAVARCDVDEFIEVIAKAVDERRPPQATATTREAKEK
jgi:hypothetical protein